MLLLGVNWTHIRSTQLANTRLPQPQIDQRSRHRRPGKRMSRRPSAQHGSLVRRLHMCFTGIPLPTLHQSRVQPRRRFHTGRRGIRFSRRHADCSRLHNATFVRDRHNLRGDGVGSRGPHERTPGSVCADDSGVSSCATGYPCVIDPCLFVGPNEALVLGL